MDRIDKDSMFCFERATPDQVGMIVQFDDFSSPKFPGENVLERLYKKHRSRLNNRLIYYYLLYELQLNGNRIYFGYLAFQWNLREEITLEWPGAGGKTTLAANQALWNPLLGQLQKLNPRALEQDFLYIMKVRVAEVYESQGLRMILVNHLKEIADAAGVKILLFAEGRPDNTFIDFYTEKQKYLEKRAQEDAAALQEQPRVKAFQNTASYSRVNAEIYRRLVGLLDASVADEKQYPQDFYREMGFGEAEVAFRWKAKRVTPDYGELRAARMMCPLEYVPKKDL